MSYVAHINPFDSAAFDSILESHLCAQDALASNLRRSSRLSAIKMEPGPNFSQEIHTCFGILHCSASTDAV
jgi:hypothetical protein